MKTFYDISFLKKQQFKDEDDISDLVPGVPCICAPRPPEYGPERYEEFEANLNGSGLTIRVLKDSHIVEDAGDVDFDEGEDCGNMGADPNRYEHICGSDVNELMKNVGMRTELQRLTGGKITNDTRLPIVRGNIKYSGDGSCSGDGVNVPLLNKLPPYKGVSTFLKKPTDIRNCCFQVHPEDIDAKLHDINSQAKRKGIEVCYKACEDPETDVFVIRLGKKKPLQSKRNAIEIELRTPKEPCRERPQKWTKETQVEEDILLAMTKKKKRKKK